MRQQMVIGGARMSRKPPRGAGSAWRWRCRRRSLVVPLALGALATLSAANPASAMADESEQCHRSEHAVPPSPAASPGNSPAPVKYYVVGPPNDGQREFLFEIAAETLGDGLRYVEIFELNLGRPQPDGRRLVNPTIIEPGWILLLPPDASGPSVRTGPLPQPRRSSVASGATPIRDLR